MGNMFFIIRNKHFRENFREQFVTTGYTCIAQEILDFDKLHVPENIKTIQYVK